MPERTSMGRREFLGLAAGAAASLVIGEGAAEAARGRRRPNFVVIFADDQGYQDVGCFGAPLIKTPCLDRMAEEGMKLTDFYVAAPVCTPSRAALLTACYPQRVGLGQGVLFPQSKTGISADEVTLAEVLKTRQYATMCIGKWHLGHLPPFLPTRHGFDRYYGIPYSNDMQSNKRGDPPLPLMRDEEVVEAPAVQATLTERYTDEAVKFITENKERPFFLYLPHTMPHVPLHVSERFAGKSKGGLYGDVIECLDWSTGQILDTLRREGLDENTLVIYTSDNGPWLSQKANGGAALPLRSGKGSTWEGGMREPCIAWWPGRIPAGSVCSEVATTMDLLPTFAGLAGARMPRDRILDGKDIRPLLEGKRGAKSPHEAFYYYRGLQLQAVRSGQWKYAFGRKENVYGKVEESPDALYDLKADIGETTDVSAQHPEVVKRLQALADRCREDLGDARRGIKGRNIRPCGRV